LNLSPNKGISKGSFFSRWS